MDITLNMSCPNCGNELPEPNTAGSMVCPKCGMYFQVPDKRPSILVEEIPKVGKW